jgi:hypothetical protein
MSEEIDKHVLRKYEIQQKLGKGVRRTFTVIFYRDFGSPKLNIFSPFATAGVWHRVEGSRQEDERHRCSQEDF